jgi:Ca-activated chloride channel family protein
MLSVIAAVLSACAPMAAPPSAPAAAPAAPVADAPRPADSRLNRNSNAPHAAAKPTEAPNAEAPAVPAPHVVAAEAQAPAPPLPQSTGPKPIAGDNTDNNRIPVEPTSVAAKPTPVDNTFKDYGVNPFIDTYRDHQSTFALDVDTASYSVMRRYIQDGSLPPYDSVRAEEFINYFAQDYELPRGNAFAVYADGAPSPFHRDGSYLLRFGVQGYAVSEAERKPASLTFVIDVSGSMQMENRLGLVKRSLQMLVDRLRPSDSVSIVVFGSTARVVLYPTSGDQKDRILNAIYALKPEGSTNTEAGLTLGYQMAVESFLPGGINRVILCSDGVGNVGTTDPVALINSVKGRASDEVMLTTVGFGMGNFNDVMLETLADKGNGFYAYIDTLEEARKLFIDRLTNTLETIAKDAKVQVEFNGDVVEQYRLIGYENRGVADQDFRNDSVDAGELNSGHNATAIYQIKLRPNARGKIATLFLRWQDVNTGGVKEIAGDVFTTDMVSNFSQTSARYQMNAVVAQFAEILRQSPYATTPMSTLSSYASDVARLLPQDADVQEFAQLVQRASTLR